MSASDSDDYMSAAFLNDASAPPSLLPPSKKRRVSRAPPEAKTLQEGLLTEIGPDNVGFKLLSKMGFKKGSSLGMSGGITEPIQIVLKNDKKGLGQGLKSASEISTLERKDIDPLEFRSQISSKFEIKQIRDDVLKARKIIEQMDLINEKQQNELWPTRSEEFEDSEFDLLDPQMQLKQTILYLRSVYRYCLYCGCKFETEMEMDDECPGDAREDHD